MATKSSDLAPCQNQSLFLIIEESLASLENIFINTKLSQFKYLVDE
jgi:hypothetical protein